jgi:hypothetical protein
VALGQQLEEAATRDQDAQQLLKRKDKEKEMAVAVRGRRLGSWTKVGLA